MNEIKHISIPIKEYCDNYIAKFKNGISFFEGVSEKYSENAYVQVESLEFKNRKRKWTKPILEFLKDNDKKIKTLEVAQYLEPNFNQFCKKDREFIISKISYALCNLNKNKYIIKETDKTKGALWSINKNPEL